MPTYEPNITAVLCIDFYNDFMSEGGKLFPLIKDIAEEVGAFENFRKIVDAARAAGTTIFHVPHHRMEPGRRTPHRAPDYVADPDAVVEASAV